MCTTGTLYVTHVDIDSNLLKIWGQRDKDTGKFIEKYLQQLSSKLNQITSQDLCHVQKGMLCFVQYTNGYYHRARIVSNLQNEKIWVFFVDYGNTELVHISNIKIQEIDENLAKLGGQAEDFYLARVFVPAGGWTDEIINKIRSDICNKEFGFAIIAQPADQKILELKLGNEDFSNLLIKHQNVQSITIQEQTKVILSYCSLVPYDKKQKLPLDLLKSNFSNSSPHLGRPISSKLLQEGHLPKKLPSHYNYETSNIPPNYSHCSPAQYTNSKQIDQMFLAPNKIDSIESKHYPKIIQKVSSDNSQSYTSEHEAILLNHSNMMNQINNRPEQLLNSSNNVMMKVLTQQLRQYFSRESSKANAICDSIPHNYVNSVFEVGSTHNIIISYIDDGPWSFSIQTVSSENELNKLMEELTLIKLIPVKRPLVLGHPCIGASKVYKNLCRGVIVGISHSAIKIYFVDFGNTEDLPMSSIFELPHNFFATKVLSQKFCLSGLQKVPYSNQIKSYFKEVVSDELLMLRVTSLEGDNLPSCDLYLKNKNIKRILNDKILNSKCEVEDICKPGDVENVVVTWIENPERFYVQLKKRDSQLDALKEELSHIDSKSKLLTFQDLVVGLRCICKYSSDGQWYRVIITSVLSESNISVFYVDYGNSENVEISYLRKIEGNGLINQISNQAIECCLLGFENKSFNQDLTKELEILMLDKDFKIMVSSVDNGKLFVRLYDSFDKEIDINILLSKSNQKFEKFKNDTCTPVKITRTVLNDSKIKIWGNKQHYDSRTKFEKSKKFFENSENSIRHENKNPKYIRHEEEKNNWKTLKEKQNLDSFSYPGKFKKGFQAEKISQEKFMHDDKLICSENIRSGKSKFNVDKSNKDFNGKKNKKNKKENKFEENPKNLEECKGNGNFYDEPSRHRNDLREDEHFYGKKKLKKKLSESSLIKNTKNTKNKKNNDYGINFNRTEKRLKDISHIKQEDVAPIGAKYKKRTIDIGTSEKAIVTYYINPYEFYVQILTEEEDFRKMMKEIQSYYYSLNCVQSPVKEGDAVIAQFSLDKILYRAEVVKLAPLTVRYIDYGNEEKVEINQIWLLAKQFLNLPVQVVKCRLANIQPTELCSNECDQIEKFFESEEYMCTFLGCADDVYEVELKVVSGGQNVADEIIAAGYGQPTIPKLDIPEYDFSLLPNQILRLFVSYVENSSKFYVILNSEYDQIIAENIKNLAKNKKALKAIQEPLLPNTFCLATKDGLIWFRGTVISVSSDKISVQLLDRGDIIEVTSEQIKILPEYLKSVQFQAVECFLCEDKESVLVNDLKNLIEHKHLLVSIISVSNEKRLSVVLYNDNGNKLDFQVGDDYPKFVEPIGQLPVIVNKMQVKISHFESPTSIYVQKTKDVSKVKTLSDELAEFYENSKVDFTCEKNRNLVAAKSDVSDKWFRGFVINTTDDDTASVFFIDFGWKENILCKNVKNLHPTFYSVNALAKKVSLNSNENFNRNECSDESLMELLKEKDFLGRFSNQNGNFTCEFFLKGISFFSKFSSSVSLDSEKIDDTTTVTATEKLLRNNGVDSMLKVFVRHIESPKKFWVNTENSLKNLGAFQSRLQSALENFPDKQNLQIFDVVAAFYLDSWYRVKIVGIDESIVSVKFIDVGNIVKTNLDSLKVKELSQEFLTEPAFSTCYSLRGNWKEDATGIFKKIIRKLKNPLDLNILEKDNLTVVDLFKDGLSISEYLKEESLKENKAEENDDFLTVYITHINSPDDFYIQKDTLILENLLDMLSEPDKFDIEDIHLTQENKIYLAQYPEDENWYRAKVLKKNEEKLEVLFIDYGNVSVVSQVKALPPEIAEIPCLGENYSLFMENEYDFWSEAACAKFAEYDNGQALKMQIVGYRKERPILKLFCNEKNISEELASFCENDGRTEVCVSHVNSPIDFFVHHLNDISFDFIAYTIKSKVDWETLEDPTPDTVCLARCSKDLLLYRGKILKNLDKGCEVFFIDYGHTGISTEFKKLSEELQKISPRALKCKLNMDEKYVSEIVKKKFVQLIDGGETVFRCDIITPGETNIISLKLNGELLENSLLIDSASDDKISDYSSYSQNEYNSPNSSCDKKTDDEKNLKKDNTNGEYLKIEQDLLVENETHEEKTVGREMNSSDKELKDFKSDDEKKMTKDLTNDRVIFDDEIIPLLLTAPNQQKILLNEEN